MFHHVTVLQKEAVAGLALKPDGIYVDCTLGGAGHSSVIAAQLTAGGLLIALDQDDEALANARERLAPWADCVRLVKRNFVHLDEVIREQVPGRQVDGVLYDLGVSSPQLDEAERGFSYNHEAALDMRMDRTQTLTATHIVNEWSEEQLAHIMFAYGEEKFARRIAKLTVQARKLSQIETTSQMVEIIKQAIPAPARRTGPHPAKRTFQALRIAVNDELRVFEQSLAAVPAVLAPQGRVAVITFHSLEDRICKQTFAGWAQGCTCPPAFPQCVCGKQPAFRLVTRKPLEPTEAELELNPRARSAKLRVAQKI